MIKKLNRETQNESEKNPILSPKFSFLIIQINFISSRISPFLILFDKFYEYDIL